MALAPRFRIQAPRSSSLKKRLISGAEAKDFSGGPPSPFLSARERASPHSCLDRATSPNVRGTTSTPGSSPVWSKLPRTVSFKNIFAAIHSAIRQANFPNIDDRWSG